MHKATINGIEVYAPTSRVELINYAYANKSILVAVNAEKILNATDDSRRIVNRNIGYPDGYGAILALESKGVFCAKKIPGCELWLDIVAKYYKDKKFYLVGGTENTIENTISKLKSNYSEIDIVGYRNGYLNSDRDTKLLIKDISQKKPDIVFVAMGSPRQEMLMEKLSFEHSALYQGLGGSFDVYTGNTKRAPERWLKLNLEWLYRLVCQPARINRQFKLVYFYFLVKLNLL